jgi:hypothetical protein
MGDQKTGAILPLFYIYICLVVWFIVKKPQFAIVGILSVVTGILILGYELQERKIGVKIATANLYSCAIPTCNSCCWYGGLLHLVTKTSSLMHMFRGTMVDVGSYCR